VTIRRSGGGASVASLLMNHPDLSRSTLKRKLLKLVYEGHLQKRGVGKSTLYQVAENQVESLSRDPIATLFDPRLTARISKESAQIIEFLSQPLESRTVISYDRTFLASYKPNVTHYLPFNLRKKLKALGSVISPNETPPAGTYARQILDRLLIDLSWNSSRLEGNTYSLLDTENLFRTGLTQTSKDLKETQMILNHKAAIGFLVDSAGDIGFNNQTIFNLHGLLADNLLVPASLCGALRTGAVGIGGSAYRPIGIPLLLNEIFGTLLQKANAIHDPFEQSFFAMVHLPYLQPFADVNKRTSRLAANIPLFQANLCPLSFTEVPEKLYLDATLGIYELQRTELLRDVYEWAYERSAFAYKDVRQSVIEPDPLRVRYREEIIQIVSKWIKTAEKSKENTGVLLSDFVSQELKSCIVDLADRSRLAEILKEQIASLHEGNYARFRISSRQWANWVQGQK
jgi:Fic/DOC family